MQVGAPLAAKQLAARLLQGSLGRARSGETEDLLPALPIKGALPAMLTSRAPFALACRMHAGCFV